MNATTYKSLKSPSLQDIAEPGKPINKLNVTNHIANVLVRHSKTERKVSIDSSQLEKSETKTNKHVSIWSYKLIILIAVAFVLFFSMYTRHKVNEYNKIRDLNIMLMKLKSMFASLYEMDEKVAKGIQHAENSYNIYQSSLAHNEMTEPQ